MINQNYRLVIFTPKLPPLTLFDKGLRGDDFIQGTPLKFITVQLILRTIFEFFLLSSCLFKLLVLPLSV